MLEKAYDPKAVEDRIYEMWEKSGAFKADNKSSKEPFTISMPPPNATGQLHLGHAVMLALEDIFVRFARMQGKEALWVPGTDHAAIATESVVIKKIQKEEKMPDPRAKLGREELVRRIAEFVENSRSVIRSQVRKMGASCDWTRERYTMDASLNRCVNEVFKKMYDDGLIYRGERVVNWDTALQTTISDDEIEYKDTEAVLYTIEYVPASLTKGEPILVSTSRPETKLGDSALVVHPDDERYKHLIGRIFTVDWPRGQSINISIIADHSIDPTFGTGVLGLTPFHSKIDYEIWQRHKERIPVEPISVIGEDGRITDAIKGYAGMKVEECREAFVEDLKKAGRIVKEETYTQPLSVSYRSGKAVEVLPKLQWFIDVNKPALDWDGRKDMSLKEVMQSVVASREIEIVPERFDKIYFNWIDNLQDWCISRQIWWGHRVPVWYCKNCMQKVENTRLEEEEIVVGSLEHQKLMQSEEVLKAGIKISTSPLINCPDCGFEQSQFFYQDPDTLDTWFSSALWTWSTLVDPEKAADMSLSLEQILGESPDFKKFHPTTVMETGYDIIFFWVARMILMTTYVLSKIPELPTEKKIPFKTVYLHGMVRDRNGQKMSKSKPETMIDPLDIIPKYGADALRLSMIVGQSPGADSRLYEEKIAGYRNFINKLWNASRFVLMQCKQAGVDPQDAVLDRSVELSLADRALLSRLGTLIADVTDGLTNYRLSDVGEKLYSFVWEFYCDWYLELSKGNTNIAVLVDALRTILVLLHPYCPFVTEELWSQVKPKDAGQLITHPWPIVQGSLKDEDAEEKFALLTEIITLIRKLRTDYNVEPNQKVRIILDTGITAVGDKIINKDFFGAFTEHITRMCRLSDLIINPPESEELEEQLRNSPRAIFKYGEIWMLDYGIDTEKEKAVLTKEKENLERFIGGIEAKLSNEQFVSKAPAALVEEQKTKLSEIKEKLSKIEERLKSL